MAFWDRWLGIGRKSSSLDLLRQLFGAPSKSGLTVNVDTALQVTTVLDCVRVLAEGVAQVPLKLLRETDDGRTRTPAKDHPLYNILYARANDWQTSFEFRETLMFHAALAGDFVAFKNVVGGRIVELVPLEPRTVTVKQDARTLTLTYEVRGSDGSVRVYPSEVIWHVRGPSWNSWLGMGAVKLAREAIGLSMAAESSQSALHKNGGRVGGILSVDGVLKDEQYKQLRAHIEQEFGGTANDGKWLIADRAAKFSQMVMSGVDAQHLETRKFQIEEICRAFRVMPIMIGHADKTATYASAEQMFLAHVVHTLAPWYSRLEQSINANLLSDEDRDGGLYAKFNANGLMRGASADRAAFYASALGSGGSPAWLEVNEVRELEDRNAVPWGDGKPQSTNQTPAADPSPDDDTE